MRRHIKRLGIVGFNAAVGASRLVHHAVLNVIVFNTVISACGPNMINFITAMPEMPVTWQCGFLGLRVGEASHPGPICALRASQ
eukprot:9685539-Karenia_brevis.AAC.1